jgi:hypothetical protein
MLLGLLLHGVHVGLHGAMDALKILNAPQYAVNFLSAVLDLTS